MTRTAPLAALLLSTPAFARPTASLWVDNQFEGPVSVVVDGRLLGTVRGREDALFPVAMGHHHVLVQAGNGVVLTSEHEWFGPWDVESVDVRAPLAPLTVHNKGVTPIFVEGAAGGLWIEPGGSRTAQVPAGSVRLTASVDQHGRMFPIDADTVWVEPGRGGRTAFAHVPPPTRLVVTNREPRPLHVALDGRPMGELPPGATVAWDVRPGLHELDAWCAWGGVVHDGAVRVAPGAVAELDLFRARPAPPPPRPGHRPGHAHR